MMVPHFSAWHICFRYIPTLHNCSLYHIYFYFGSLNNFLSELQAAEDPQYSVMAKVELKKFFGKRTVSNLLYFISLHDKNLL